MSDPTANDITGIEPCSTRFTLVGGAGHEHECTNGNSRHTGDHVCKCGAHMPPPRLWPPTSEHDAHLAAYRTGPPNLRAAMRDAQAAHEAHLGAYLNEPTPPTLADVLEGLTEAIRETLPAIGEAFTAMSDTLRDPAPAGLTAAQEIRLRVFETLDRGNHGFEVDELMTAVPTVAALIEHGTDVTDQSPLAVWYHDCGQAFSSYGPHPDKCFSCHQSGTWTVRGPQCCPRCHTPWQDHDTDVLKRCDAMDGTAACPDPALHDLREAHADLEASRAREQIAAERVARALAYLDHAEGYDFAPDIATLRAILTGDQGEEAHQ